MNAREIELSRELAARFPWSPRIGDAYFCHGRLLTVWQLPAPCHPEDFRVWGLYESKSWLHDQGIHTIEMIRADSGWTICVTDPGSGEKHTASGQTDTEAALALVVEMTRAGGAAF